MEQAERRELLVSRTWVQGVILVILVGFFILGLLAYRQYQEHPPVPTRVVGEGGRVLFTGDDVSDGQKVFLQNGLMQYGSAFGHGAYLGPDYTADYLRRASNFVRDAYGGATSDNAARRTIGDFRAQPLRRADRHAHVHRRAGRRVRDPGAATTAASSQTPRLVTASGRRRSPTRATCAS